MNTNEIFQLILLIAIAWLAFNVITMISSAMKKRKFVIKGYLKDESENKVTILERFTSFRKYKEYLEIEMKEAQYEKTVEAFLLQRIIMAISLLLMMVLFYRASNETLFLYLSIPVAFFMYKLPKKQLQKRKKHNKHQLKSQLTEYLYHFALMLEGVAEGFYTPLKATQKSADYAGTLLKPHVEHLITQINLYPASYKPYHDFAEAVPLREAKEFMTALEQLMKVDAKTASKIIKDQIQIMDELQEEAYNEQIESYPDRVEPFIDLMLMPFVLILLATIGVFALESLSGI